MRATDLEYSRTGCTWVRLNRVRIKLEISLAGTSLNSVSRFIVFYFTCQFSNRDRFSTAMKSYLEQTARSRQKAGLETRAQMRWSFWASVLVRMVGRWGAVRWLNSVQSILQMIPAAINFQQSQSWLVPASSVNLLSYSRKGSPSDLPATRLWKERESGDLASSRTCCSWQRRYCFLICYFFSLRTPSIFLIRKNLMSDLPTYSVEPLMRAHTQLNSLRKRIRSELTSLSISRKKKIVHPQKPFKQDYNRWFVKPQFKLKKRQQPANKADLIREPQFFYKILSKPVILRPGPFSRDEPKVVWKKRERLDPQYDRQSQQLRIAAYQRLGRVPECLD